MKKIKTFKPSEDHYVKQENFKILTAMKTKIEYFVIFFILLLFGCKTLEIPGYWRNGEIKIDGNCNDWEGKTWTIKDLKNVLVGVMNDSNFFYLSLTISDKALQRQVAFGGLTVWFDRNGGNDKIFGIHYPLGMEMRDMPTERRRPRQDQDRESDTAWTFPEQFSNEIDIEGPMEGEHHRIALLETGGIEAAMHFSKGLLTYEIKIPLRDNGPQPYVIGTTAGSIIGVGVETANRGERGSRQMLGSGSGEEPGGGFGGRRRSGGEQSFGRGERAEPLKLWAKVKLAIPDPAIIHQDQPIK